MSLFEMNDINQQIREHKFRKLSFKEYLTSTTEKYNCFRFIKYNWLVKTLIYDNEALLKWTKFSSFKGNTKHFYSCVVLISINFFFMVFKLLIVLVFTPYRQYSSHVTAVLNNSFIFTCEILNYKCELTGFSWYPI